MQRLCCILAMLLHQAVRITNAVEYPYFPNFRGVHHGGGATSYQYVQISNGASIPVLKNYELHGNEALHFGSEHYGQYDTVVPDGGRYNRISELTEIADRLDLKPEAIPARYEHGGYEQDYRYYI